MKALVIGGTGPTGPFVVNGLLSRGFTVTILNRGTLEVPDIPEVVERIVGDPHFEETLKSALDGRNFDIIIALETDLDANRLKDWILKINHPNIKLNYDIGNSVSNNFNPLINTGQKNPYLVDQHLLEKENA